MDIHLPGTKSMMPHAFPISIFQLLVLALQARLARRSQRGGAAARPSKKRTSSSSRARTCSRRSSNCSSVYNSRYVPGPANGYLPLLDLIH